MFKRNLIIGCFAVVVLFGASQSAQAQSPLYETKYDVYRTVIDNQWKVEVDWKNGDSTTYGPYPQQTAFGLYAQMLSNPNAASVELVAAWTSETEYLGRFDTEAEAEEAKADAEDLDDTGVVWIHEVYVPRTFLFMNLSSNVNYFSRYFAR